MRSFRIVGSEEQISLIENLLEIEGFCFQKEEFSPLFCRKLTKEPFALGNSLAHFFGYIYIQDRSSMLAPVALDVSPNACVLDMCASPGSKTSFLGQLVGKEGFVLGVEASADRLATLRSNLRNLNLSHIATTKAQAQMLPFPADTWEYIQLDPPCSGWGTLEKNPSVTNLWTKEKITPLITLQRELLTKAAEILKPNGIMLYSTCTTNEEENDEQVAWACANLPLEQVRLATPKGFTIADGKDTAESVSIATSPDAQGFFLAALKKKEPEYFEPDFSHKEFMPVGNKLKIEKLVSNANIAWKNLPAGDLYDFQGRVFFLPQKALEIIPQEMKWQGFPLGRLAQNIFRPDSTARILLPDYNDIKNTPHAYNIEDIADIKILLSGRALSAPKGKGFVALYFNSLPLGWLTQKGTRLLWNEKR